MSSYSPESKRINFDYEISSGKTALRIFKHEKEFERLFLIPSKNIEENVIFRLTVKPEVNDNIFGINGGVTNSSSDTTINKRHSSGGSTNKEPFTFASISNSFNNNKLDVFGSSTNEKTAFPPTPVPMAFTTKVSVQVSLLSISKSLKENGLNTSIKIVFRDYPSIIILVKYGNFTFTETDRSFEISMPINEFNHFPKEIIVNVEITITNMVESALKEVFIRDLSNDFSNLFESKQYTDTTLVVDDGEFNVHRGILAARSPVFSAMFERTMKEGLSGTAVIEDIDKEVLNELLYFIYTGKVKNLKEYGPGLLVASDKYNIPMLKEICEEFLANNLTLEMACECLILADIHSCETLKPKCTEFVIGNAVQVTKTTGWKNMIKSHPYLVAEMFESMAISAQKAESENPEVSNG
ncbi:SPOPL.2 family protein [Megaselia abdita]